MNGVRSFCFRSKLENIIGLGEERAFECGLLFGELM